MYYIYDIISGPFLLIESTDSMIESTDSMIIMDAKKLKTDLYYNIFNNASVYSNKIYSKNQLCWGISSYLLNIYKLQINVVQ